MTTTAATTTAATTAPATTAPAGTTAPTAPATTAPAAPAGTTTTVTYWTQLDSPLGPLLLTAAPSGELTSLSVPGQKGGRTVRDGWRRDPGPFREAERQLAAYFAGELKEFRLALRTAGTPFRERVWAALDDVPYGTTVTYGEIAARIGASRPAVRAVGGAIGANPLLIVRPCHRVIGSNGSLTGYAGGLDCKVHLLTHEGALRP